MEDSSLDDFLDAGETDAGEDTGTDDVGEDDGREEGNHEADGTADDGGEGGDDVAVEPAKTTFRWAPDGVTCEACGSGTDRLWSSETGLVCADCKDW